MNKLHLVGIVLAVTAVVASGALVMGGFLFGSAPWYAKCILTTLVVGIVLTLAGKFHQT